MSTPCNENPNCIYRFERELCYGCPSYLKECATQKKVPVSWVSTPTVKSSTNYVEVPGVRGIFAYVKNPYRHWWNPFSWSEPKWILKEVNK